MIASRLLSSLASLSACVLALALSGCALSSTATPDPVAGAAISGMVHGGQQPISGARVYLLAANPAGYGTASLSLLTTALTGNAVDSIGAYGTSASSGAFDVTGDYSCTTGYAQGASTTSGGISLPGNEQVYLLVLGGNPGLGTGTNANIGLMAALGPCNAQFSPILQVNEITTVAAAYALAGFATDATHVSSSGSALAVTGLTNAGLNSRNLADVFSGTSPSIPIGRNGIVPTATVITIANILGACINGASGNNACSTLFQYTRTGGASGTAATDTATAAIHLAHNPYPTAAGLTALYGLVPAAPAFGGGLTTQPNDFTLSLTFTGGGFGNGTGAGLAIDAAGNVWATSGPRLCKFASTGAAISTVSGYTGGGFTGVINIAIDTYGNVWAPNLSNTISEFFNSGLPVTATGAYNGSAGGVSTPLGIAIDASNNVWIANRPGSLSKFSSSGTALSPSGGFIAGGANDAFYGVAIDVSGNAWVANYFGSFDKFSPAGAPLSGTTGFYGGGLQTAYAVAIDAVGNLWAPDYYVSTVSELNSSGTPISGRGGYTAGGLNSPISIAIDSAGNVWVANFNGNSISMLTNSGTGVSPSPAYGVGSGIYGPVNIALDGSGDVWVTNYNGTLSELVGAGSPVVTPLAANLVTPYGSATVNRP